ncbi:MAG TPA: hypothetical protein VEC39_11955 [Vicinamibacterales bacterium]|nr:hypothetical protein [Vicinamibacterales bacterium]
MRNVPAAARSEADTCATSVVALTSNVGRVSPSISTSEVSAKSAPVTVKRMAGPPAVIVVGAIDIRRGAGGGAVTVNGDDGDVLPSGVCTLT